MKIESWAITCLPLTRPGEGVFTCGGRGEGEGDGGKGQGDKISGYTAGQDADGVHDRGHNAKTSKPGPGPCAFPRLQPGSADFTVC
jgi:hypothetical protein